MKAATSNSKCGTYAGVNRHRNHGESLCAECRPAANAYIRAYRRRKGQPLIERIHNDERETILAAIRALNWDEPVTFAEVLASIDGQS